MERKRKIGEMCPGPCTRLKRKVAIMEGDDNVYNETGVDTGEPQVEAYFLKVEHQDTVPPSIDDYNVYNEQEFPGYSSSSQNFGEPEIDIGDVKLLQHPNQELKLQEAEIHPVNGHLEIDYQALASIKLRTHQEDRSFKCNHCGFTFSQRPNLKRHLKKFHKNSTKEDSRSDIRSNILGEKRPIELTILKKLGLSTEKARYIARLNIRPCAIQLERCDRRFEGNGNSNGAREKPAAISSGVQMPVKTVLEHASSLPGYGCQVCDTILLTSTDLTLHMRTHEEVKPHKCSMCSMAFATLSNLTFHFKSHGFKPYKCEVCMEQFPFSGKLEKHMLETHNKEIVQVHNSEKRYKCPKCFNSKFKTKGGLKKHIIEFHKRWEA